MHYKYEYTHRLQVHGWKNYISYSSKYNKAGMTMLIPDTVEFMTKNQEETIHINKNVSKQS